MKNSSLRVLLVFLENKVALDQSALLDRREHEVNLV
jgi:hypothetical protein